MNAGRDHHKGPHMTRDDSLRVRRIELLLWAATVALAVAASAWRPWGFALSL